MTTSPFTRSCMSLYFSLIEVTEKRLNGSSDFIRHQQLKTDKFLHSHRNSSNSRALDSSCWNWIYFFFSERLSWITNFSFQPFHIDWCAFMVPHSYVRMQNPNLPFVFFEQILSEWFIDLSLIKNWFNFIIKCFILIYRFHKWFE